MNQKIETTSAPKPVGPYSQGIVTNGMVFLSGQVGMDVVSGKLVGNDIESQLKQIFKNIEAVLSAAGVSVTSIVKTTIFLTNLEDFKEVNTIYGEWVRSPTPARTTVEVSKLPLGALVEIEVIASL